MSYLLQALIDETVEEILSNERQDGLDLPIQAERAARQVVDRVILTGSVLERLFGEVVSLQEDEAIVEATPQLAHVSLSDFIAKAAKKQMGGEYQALLHRRTLALLPSQGQDCW